MEGISSALCQWWTSGKRDTLVSDGALALGVGLLVLALVVVLVFVVVPQAEFDGSLDTMACLGVSSAPWDLLGGYYDSESDAASAGVAQWTIVSKWPTAEVIQWP
jgi:hypothetical protein